METMKKTSLIRLLNREEWLLSKVEIFEDTIMQLKQLAESHNDDWIERECEEYTEKINKVLEELHEIRHQIKEYFEMLSNY